MPGDMETYYLQRLSEEQLRLVNASSLAAEDAARTQIEFYYAKLRELGLVYDAEQRCWTVVEPGTVPEGEGEIRFAASPQTGQPARHEWQLRFHSPTGGIDKRVELTTNAPNELLRLIDRAHGNVEVWRDGKFVCTVVNRRATA